MKTRPYCTFLACFTTGIFMSCNLDNSSIECPPNYTGSLADSEKILIGEWVLSAIDSDIEVDLTDDNVDNPEKNLYTQYNACEKDAGYTFNLDRSYSFDQGNKAANCTNKRISKGSWKLSGESLSLVVNCTTLTDKISFNEGMSEFSFINNINVKEVNGTTQLAKITFVYSKIEP